MNPTLLFFWLQDPQRELSDDLGGDTQVYGPTIGASPVWSHSYPVSWNSASINTTSLVECYIKGRFEIDRPCRQALLADNIICSHPGIDF